jgi:isopentenyl diphosphate isomerase/L-lactate dehydrogenase-like FMN-dependent dehydrogenase
MVVVSSRSSVPFSQLAAEAPDPLWYSVYAESGAIEQARSAATAGAGAIFITVGAAPPSGDGRVPARAAPIDWNTVDAIAQPLTVPVVIKGIRTAAEAAAALQHGADGIVVSNHGAMRDAGAPSPVDNLSAIADTVEGRVPILIDGSFRRGTDVLKALILGAQAVMIGRPAAWGLAGYGADGVQWVTELIQNELARSMGMLGTPTPAHLTRDHIRRHTRATP